MTAPLLLSNHNKEECAKYTAISRKVVGHATILKGNMGYDQCTVPDTVVVEPYTFVSFL